MGRGPSGLLRQRAGLFPSVLGSCVLLCVNVRKRLERAEPDTRTTQKSRWMFPILLCLFLFPAVPLLHHLGVIRKASFTRRFHAPLPTSHHQLHHQSSISSEQEVTPIWQPGASQSHPHKCDEDKQCADARPLSAHLRVEAGAAEIFHHTCASACAGCKEAWRSHAGMARRCPEASEELMGGVNSCRATPPPAGGDDYLRGPFKRGEHELFMTPSFTISLQPDVLIDQQ